MHTAVSHLCMWGLEGHISGSPYQLISEEASPFTLQVLLAEAAVSVQRQCGGCGEIRERPPRGRRGCLELPEGGRGSGEGEWEEMREGHGTQGPMDRNSGQGSPSPRGTSPLGSTPGVSCQHSVEGGLPA